MAFGEGDIAAVELWRLLPTPFPASIRR
jgi:hypothetical protein